LAQPHGDTLQWCFKRNCAISPSQLAGTFALLCCFSLAVAVFFWAWGVRWIMPFTAIELTAVGAAFVVYGRHATNGERIELRSQQLVIQQEHGGRVAQTVFDRQRVRVEQIPVRGGLIEIREGDRRVRCGHHMRPDLRQHVVQEIRLALKGF
jgi:uncharacterized membrane protein